jgi:hypothetical protein
MVMAEDERHVDNFTYASITTLRFCQLWTTIMFYVHELRFWVKPHSTTSFLQFVIDEYNDD